MNWRLAVGDWLFAAGDWLLAVGKWANAIVPAACVRCWPRPPRANGQQPTANRSPFLAWLRSRRGDMVWNSLVLVAVLLPLASFTIDVPRYYVLRSRLQLAADAAAQATAQCVDMAHFQNTGETRLELGCRQREPHQVFQATVAPLLVRGYTPTLTAVLVDEAADTVTIRAQGATRLFFDLTPPITVRVAARSTFRMEVR
jgi:hypothetical protein